MANITVEEAQAWADNVKLQLGTLDGELEESISAQVLSGVAQVYDTSSWLSPDVTPNLVRKIIAMEYTGWYINRTYSEDTGLNDYALSLIGQGERLVAGLSEGTLILPDQPRSTDGTQLEQPAFYPTDAQACKEHTPGTPVDEGDYSWRLAGGGEAAKFTMGKIW